MDVVAEISAVRCNLCADRWLLFLFSTMTSNRPSCLRHGTPDAAAESSTGTASSGVRTASRVHFGHRTSCS